jgi:hypothetical protein
MLNGTVSWDFSPLIFFLRTSSLWWAPVSHFTPFFAFDFEFVEIFEFRMSQCQWYCWINKNSWGHPCFSSFGILFHRLLGFGLRCLLLEDRTFKTKKIKGVPDFCLIEHYQQQRWVLMWRTWRCQQRRWVLVSFATCGLAEADWIK